MKKTMICLYWLTLLWLALSGTALLAVDWVEKTNISGFFSTRYSVTDEAAFFHGDLDTGINDDGSFQGTKLGITIRSQISDDLSVAMLLMSADGHGNYSTHADWAFASYRLNDDFTLRAGKLKFPVGLVNEYVDVGVAYPWISAPLLLYSEEPAGAQATREAYTGSSLLWESDVGDGDWTVSSDLFFGQVDLENMIVKGVLGLTLRANWDDILELQVSSYNGTMHTDPTLSPMMALMNNKEHSAVLVGLKLDWNDIIAYVESATVEMDVMMMGNRIGNSDSWYATIGYRIDKFLPHFTYQDWQRDNGNNQQISTLGLSYHFSDSVVLKLEQSLIETDNFNNQMGLFFQFPSSGSTNMTSIAVDVIF